MLSDSIIAPPTTIQSSLSDGSRDMYKALCDSNTELQTQNYATTSLIPTNFKQFQPGTATDKEQQQQPVHQILS